MKINGVGNGKVVLISGGGKIYTDIAARFCRSERDLDSIVGSAYNKNIVRNILNSGHLAATEFDYFIFGVEGYSRVCEAQLIRKRLASYLIKSGRVELSGGRESSYVIPESLLNLSFLSEVAPGRFLSYIDIMQMVEDFYQEGLDRGIPEEDLRYLKPQATEFKAIIGMNAHALRDWFMIRMCKNAQYEIRDLATKMYNLCVEVAPDLFEGAGPSCKVLGYCPEDSRQNPKCNVIRKSKALEVLSNYRELD